MAGLDGIKNLFSQFQLPSMGSATAIGLSIGTSSIKIVELKKTGKTWKLLHFGMIQLPEDSVVNREIVNHIGVVESIKTLTNQLKLKSKQVCSSLSGTAVIIKRMSLEVPSMRELADQVFWEAEQYLPFDVSEVVMDYDILNKSKDNRVDVMLVAVKRSVLDSYMQAIEDSGLKPKVIDVDFFALQDVYEANYPTEPGRAAAIIDVGASSTKLTVVSDGIPVFTKDSAIGGRNLTADIQKHLNLSFEDAETLKISGASGSVPQEVVELMSIANENIASEIKRAIDFYDASSTGAPVTEIFMAGGSSRIPNLTKMVESVTGMPTQLLNPFHAISYDPNIFTEEYIQSIGPIAAVPVGLAIRAGAER